MTRLWRWITRADLHEDIAALQQEVRDLGGVIARQVLTLHKIQTLLGETPEDLRDPKKHVSIRNRFGL